VKHPYFDPKARVKLKILYDGKEQKVEYRDGKAFVNPPKVDQEVKFVLTRDAAPVRYGAVLKINGESTVFKQKLPDQECRRWIMAPDRSSITITGYQLDNDTEEAFRVATPAESADRMVHYGEAAGTFTLTVFQELKGEELVQDATDSLAPKVKILRKGAIPPAGAENDGALKKQLEDDADRGMEDGGLIVPGDRTKSEVTRTKFKPHPTPVMSFKIFYFKP